MKSIVFWVANGVLGRKLDVSEKCITYIFTVEEQAKQETIDKLELSFQAMRCSLNLATC
jgi:hypothetical protein